MKRVMFFVLLVSSFSFSQFKGGEAVYGVTYTEDVDNENQKKIKDIFTSMYPNIETTANELLFKLEFNNELSVFYANEFEGIVSSNEVKLAQGMIGYAFKTWQNTDFYYRYNERQSYVGQRPKNFEWQITSESKTIDNFLCYKAIGFETITNKKVGRVKKAIIAWFCPEIPYSYGPLHFGGLPGLILELQTQEAVFGLKNLTLKDTKVEKMPNVYLKTEEEILKEEQVFLEEYNKSKNK